MKLVLHGWYSRADIIFNIRVTAAHVNMTLAKKLQLQGCIFCFALRDQADGVKFF